MPGARERRPAVDSNLAYWEKCPRRLPNGFMPSCDQSAPEPLAAGGPALASSTGECLRCFRTVKLVAINDRPVDLVRRTVTYRDAVWCQRLAYASSVVWIFTAFGHPFSLLRFLPWFVAALL